MRTEQRVVKQVPQKIVSTLLQEEENGAVGQRFPSSAYSSVTKMQYLGTIAPAMGERTTPGCSKSVNSKLVLVLCKGAGISASGIASSAANGLLFSQ